MRTLPWWRAIRWRTRNCGAHQSGQDTLCGVLVERTTTALLEHYVLDIPHRQWEADVSITARRMIFGDELKYRNGLADFRRRGIPSATGYGAVPPEVCLL